MSKENPINPINPINSCKELVTLIDNMIKTPQLCSYKLYLSVAHQTDCTEYKGLVSTKYNKIKLVDNTKRNSVSVITVRPDVVTITEKGYSQNTIIKLE